MLGTTSLQSQFLESSMYSSQTRSSLSLPAASCSSSGGGEVHDAVEYNTPPLPPLLAAAYSRFSNKTLIRAANSSEPDNCCSPPSMTAAIMGDVGGSANSRGAAMACTDTVCSTGRDAVMANTREERRNVYFVIIF